MQVCASSSAPRRESQNRRDTHPMRGDEARIVDAFCLWLEGQGWAIRREVDFVDVVAEKDGERIYAEAKAEPLLQGSISTPCMASCCAECRRRNLARPVSRSWCPRGPYTWPNGFLLGCVRCCGSRSTA